MNMILSARLLKPFLLFLLLLLSLFFVVPPTSAQEQSSSQNPYTQPNTNSDVPKDLNTLTQSVVTNVASAFICQLIGIDVTNPNQKCLGVDPKTGKLGFVQNGGGLIGLTTMGIAMTFQPPIHTGDYLHDMASNFGIVKPTYAASNDCLGGVGYCGLKPLLTVWRKILDITYLLFIIAFVGVGLGIMLRIKIDPRTVMTIENHIPKLIIGLILVTFSLPIVGALIDGMWIFTYASVSLLASADATIRPDLVNNQINESPIGFVNEFYKDTRVDVGLPGGNKATASPGGTGGEIGGGIVRMTGQAGLDIQRIFANLLTPKNIPEIFSPAINGIPNMDRKCGLLDVGCRLSFIAGEVTLGTIGNILSAIIGGLLSVAFGLLGFLFILAGLLWALLRLWLELIKAYIRILISTILGPLWIVGGVFPGSPVTFTTWFREIVGELLVFPTVIIMFALGKIIMDAVGSSNGQLFTPPLIGNPNASTFGAIIGFGIIAMTPQVVNMIKDAMKAPQFKYGAAVGQAFGIGPGLVNQGWTAVSSPYGLLAGWTNMKRNMGGAGGAISAAFHRKPKEEAIGEEHVPTAKQAGGAA